MVDTRLRSLPLEVTTAFTSKQLHSKTLSRRLLHSRDAGQAFPSRVRSFVTRHSPIDRLHALNETKEPAPDVVSFAETAEPVTVVAAARVARSGKSSDTGAGKNKEHADHATSPGSSGEPPSRPPGSNPPIEMPDPGGPEEGRYEPHPVDSLRADFNQHVIGPLSHVVVVSTLDAIGENFIESLRGKLGETTYHNAIPYMVEMQDSNAVRALDRINFELRQKGQAHLQQQKASISSAISFSPRQRAAATRFGTRRMLSSLENGLFFELIAIESAVDIINKKHPKLGLENTENLVDFLRDPDSQRIFRGFATGGNAFLDGFRRTAHPATKPWWRDKKKPVLQITEGVKRITNAVLKAARFSREENERLLDHPLSSDEQFEVKNFGLIGGSAKRFSSGCPARHVLFQTNVPSLVDQELSLSSDQADALIPLTTPPVIKKFDESNYLIVRDAYAEASGLLADALEAVAAHKPGNATT